MPTSASPTCSFRLSLLCFGLGLLIVGCNVGFEQTRVDLESHQLDVLEAEADLAAEVVDLDAEAVDLDAEVVDLDAEVVDLDADKCAQTCSADATCAIMGGAFACVCNVGYSGNGVTCTHDDYVTIPAGSFTMGSPADELGRGSDEAQHTVTLTRSFEMKTTEVTQGEWQSLMGNNPSYFPACGANCPVETVNWYEVLAYANALSTAQGLAACYTLSGCTWTAGAGMTCTEVTVTGGGGDPYACTGYRLPTEAEWEYAYRAGTTSAFYNGGITVTGCGEDPNLAAIGWYCGNASNAHAVGQKQANALGLYDMSGNVWEWCWDWYATYPGTVSNPVGLGTDSHRVGRGGSWINNAQIARAASRWGVGASYRDNGLGFRLSRSLP